MANFDRGFKSWSEKCSAGLRNELNLEAHTPLCAKALASYLDVTILKPADIKGLSSEYSNQLLRRDFDGWSAVTVTYQDNHLIIHNPRHSLSRQASNIMHELAHIITGHVPSRIVLSHDGSIVMRSFDAKQEDEAAWLSGCLLLPRAALLYIARNSLSEERVKKEYGVSSALLKYRLSVSGVNRQAGRWKRKFSRKYNYSQSK